MNFKITRNDYGYYGIIDLDTNEMILPYLFEHEEDLTSIVEIEKVRDDYYILKCQTKYISANGYYDKTSGDILLPDVNSFKNFKYYKIGPIQEIKQYVDKPEKADIPYCKRRTSLGFALELKYKLNEIMNLDISDTAKKDKVIELLTSYELITKDKIKKL